MNPLQSKWESRQIEQRFYTEIVAYFTTQNQKCENMQFGNMNNTNLTKKRGTNSGALEEEAVTAPHEAPVMLLLLSCYDTAYLRFNNILPLFFVQCFFYHIYIFQTTVKPAITSIKSNLPMRSPLLSQTCPCDHLY